MIIKPEISVLMAVYNGEKHLNEAIDAILNQTFKNLELIIVNDGSKDNSVSIIESYTDPRIKLYHNEENKGLVYTRNRLLSLANCEIITVMDCDDIAKPNKFEKQLNFLKSNLEIKLCGTFGDKIDNNSNSIGIKILPEYRKVYTNIEMLFKNQFIHSSVMLYKSIALEFGGYQKYNGCEDFDLLSKIAEKYPVANLNEILVLYREHDQGISKTNNNEINIGVAEIVKKNFSKFELNDIQNKIVYLFLNDNFDAIDEKEFKTLFSSLIQKNRKNNIYNKEIFEKVIVNHWVKFTLYKKSKINAKHLFIQFLKFDYPFTFKQLKKVSKKIF